MIFLNKSNSTGLPNGIRRAGGSGYYAVYNGKNLGKYNSLEDAFEARSKVKLDSIKRIVEEYKDVLPSNVHDALLAYKPSIAIDKNYRLA